MTALFGADAALQTALYAHLTGEPALEPHLGAPPRVYDAPPADPIFPFITFGRAEITPSDADDAVTEHTLHLHAWSRYGGRREAKDLLAVLRDSVRAATLDLGTGFALVHLRPVYADVFRQSDGRTVQGLLRLRAVVEAL